MLPGFRFLFAAILLTMSVLVFGLGAAALLRASHEQFANNPARRTLPEPVFAQSLPFPLQQTEPPVATLAMLRVDPPLAEKAPESASVGAMAAPAEPVPDAVPVPPVETERLAALNIAAPAPAEMEKSEAASPPDVAAMPAPVPSTEAAPAEAAPAPVEPVKTAAVAPDAAPAPAEQAPAAIADTMVSPAPESIGAPAKVAALSPAATTAVEPASAKPKSAEADRAKVRKRLRAQRVKERRRLAAQRAARQARQAAAQQQQAPDAFAVQPTITTTATTSRRR